MCSSTTTRSSRPTYFATDGSRRSAGWRRVCSGARQLSGRTGRTGRRATGCSVGVLLHRRSLGAAGRDTGLSSTGRDALAGDRWRGDTTHRASSRWRGARRRCSRVEHRRLPTDDVDVPDRAVERCGGRLRAPAGDLGAVGRWLARASKPSRPRQLLQPSGLSHCRARAGDRRQFLSPRRPDRRRHGSPGGGVRDGGADLRRGAGPRKLSVLVRGWLCARQRVPMIRSAQRPAPSAQRPAGVIPDGGGLDSSGPITGRSRSHWQRARGRRASRRECGRRRVRPA